MSKAAKWILGLFIGLVVLCMVVALGFVAFNSFRGTALIAGMRTPRTFDGGRLAPRSDVPWDNMHMYPNRFTRGILPFGGIFRGLFGLGFLVLIGLGVAALVLIITQSRKPAAAAATTAASASTAPEAAQPEQPSEAIPAHTCPNCQKPVDEGWSHCPYCGTALAPPE